MDFLVEDESGIARIDVDGADSALVLDTDLKSGTFEEASPEARAFLKGHRRRSTGFYGFNHRMRFREGALEPGERVAVAGAARMELFPGEPGRRGYGTRPERPVLFAPNDSGLLLSNDLSVIDARALSPVEITPQLKGKLECPHCGARERFLGIPKGYVLSELPAILRRLKVAERLSAPVGSHSRSVGLSDLGRKAARRSRATLLGN